METNKIDLKTFYANSHKILWQSQQESEDQIVNCYNADQHYTDCKVKHRLAISNMIQELKKEGMQATLIPDTAKGRCIDTYRAMLEAENLKNRAINIKFAILERIQTAKKIMSDIGEKINKGN